ncbi:MAG TPA: hypothetical protein VJ970_05445 [Flavobacteriaceae bacterium]|nr:hypothetical protein [Flavobacteriaceae bacterium]
MALKRFKKQKRPNYKRSIILIVLLLIIIYVWFNAEALLTPFFEVK